MLTLPPSVRIFLASKPTDMRKGFNSLSALVLHSFELDVYTGHLFVFYNKTGKLLKILFWDRGGFVLYYKRLERGRFRIPRAAVEAQVVEIEAGQLAMLLDGIDLRRVERPARWQPPRRSSETVFSCPG